MSDEDRTFPHEAFGADAAAYVLGALDPGEAEAFERHLEHCHSCADDLAGFKHVVDQLAMSPPQYDVPTRLRRRVIADVRSEPRHNGASRPRRRRRPIALVSRARRRGPALASALVLGLALVAVAIVTLASGGSKVQVLTARVVDSAGSAKVRLADGRAELIVRHLPAPPPGHIYEVWLKRPGRTLEPTTALFNVSSHGAADIRVPDALNGVAEILVSEEPAGGSVIPTHQPVIVGQLS